jgi:lysophospholipase L1-like esterase
MIQGQYRTSQDSRGAVTVAERFRLRLLFWTAVGTLLLAELGLWFAVPLADPYEASRWDRHYIRREHKPHMALSLMPEPGLPGMAGVTRWTTNNLGFRGDELVSPKPGNEFRIFLIGGSTAECSVLDDEDSLDAVVQRSIEARIHDGTQVKVYNAGVSGDRSDDHVAILTQRIAHLEPDMIVVFAGINDLIATISGHDYLHFPTQPLRPQPWKLFVTQSQLGRLAYYLARMQRPVKTHTAAGPMLTNYRSAVEFANAAPETSTLPAVDTRAYANNLRTLAGVAHGHGIPIIFMTQQTTWASTLDPAARDWQWLLRVGEVRYPEQAMHEALEHMNDAMREIAVAMELPLYDLAKQMPKTTEYFYDDVHFNTNGARVAGTELADVMYSHFDDPRDARSAVTSVASSSRVIALRR